MQFSLHRPLYEMRPLVAVALGNKRVSAKSFFLWNEKVDDHFTLSNACYDSSDAVMVSTNLKPRTDTLS